MCFKFPTPPRVSLRPYSLGPVPRRWSRVAWLPWQPPQARWSGVDVPRRARHAAGAAPCHSSATRPLFWRRAFSSGRLAGACSSPCRVGGRASRQGRAGYLSTQWSLRHVSLPRARRTRPSPQGTPAARRTPLLRCLSRLRSAALRLVTSRCDGLPQRAGSAASATSAMADGADGRPGRAKKAFGFPIRLPSCRGWYVPYAECGVRNRGIEGI